MKIWLSVGKKYFELHLLNINYNYYLYKKNEESDKKSRRCCNPWDFNF